MLLMLQSIEWIDIRGIYLLQGSNVADHADAHTLALALQYEKN